MKTNFLGSASPFDSLQQWNAYEEKELTEAQIKYLLPPAPSREHMHFCFAKIFAQFNQRPVLKKKILAYKKCKQSMVDHFITEYEKYQKNCKTTLTEALINYRHGEAKAIPSKVQFTAEIVPNQTQMVMYHRKCQRNEVIFQVQISKKLCDLIISNASGKEIEAIRSGRKVNLTDEELEKGLRHAHTHLDFDGYDLSKIKMLAADVLSINDNPIAAIEESFRILQGIVVNLYFVDSKLRSKLHILILNNPNQTQSFLSFFSTGGTRWPDQVADNFKKINTHLAAVPASNGRSLTVSPKEELVAVVGKGIIEDDNPLLKSKGEIVRAVAATINFCNMYRPFNAHEGSEQIIAFIIGLPDNTDKIFDRWRELGNLILPVGRDPLPLREIRSKLKAFSNIFDRPDCAIFVDATNNNNEQFSLPCVYKLSSKGYKYPNVHHLMDINRETDMALVRIHGRTRIDLFYQGKTVAAWTDKEAVWTRDVSWTEEGLVNKISEKICCGTHRPAKCVKECSIPKCKKSKVLHKIVRCIFSVAAMPKSGAAVLIPLNWTEDMVNERTQGMTTSDITSLSYIANIIEKENEDVIKMITLDGGSVVNMSNGEMWVRRKFMGPRSFTPSSPGFRIGRRGKKVLLDDIWGHSGDLEWGNRHIYREWGTRHQNSLALSASDIVDGDVIQLKSERGKYVATKTADFVVVVASSDGHITLMHNGRVIEPPQDTQ